ncbi:uncharacterized protein UV8b_05519 [Ustilaginoidea virens]|uniref:Uncharacterized protein n=1 Tax=Ustilaginoidea virens TaxID=1159556 RepID=A0A8E5MIZ6_USTVR|nr:uncharacterized protein UV8b_05519 [Ustilaginoidea virens]QUC21276.1 hypothetical protein UV8b_05519 [Ustilaginoidea virens]
MSPAGSVAAGSDVAFVSDAVFRDDEAGAPGGKERHAQPHGLFLPRQALFIQLVALASSIHTTCMLPRLFSEKYRVLTLSCRGSDWNHHDSDAHQNTAARRNGAPLCPVMGGQVGTYR